MARCLDAYGQEGFPAARRHSEIFGVFEAASGTLNKLILLSAYPDYATYDRETHALKQDAQWNAFRDQTREAVLEESQAFLNPAGCSPIKHMGQVRSEAALDSGTADGMLFELRTYTTIPGKMPRALKMLAEEGNPLTHQFVERPILYLTSETGLSNQIFMLWAYSSADERARRKSRMLPDPRFRELGARFNLNFSQQESVFWRPTPYSPLR
jgi:hypothetical protein